MNRPMLAVLSVCLLLLTGCASGERLAPRPQSARTVPARSAPRRPTIRDTATLRLLRGAWERAGREALAAAVPIEGTYTEQLSLPGDQPAAVAYELALERGERLALAVEPAPDAADFALDVLERITPDSFVVVRTLRLRPYEFAAPQAGTFVVRLQPAVGGGGDYGIRIGGGASLHFPIPGFDVAAIRSPFGSARDGGARQHEGVDIFAPRGTPVIAAAGGFVTRVESTRSGGRVVWAENPEQNLTYYYAHLDAQLVRRGARLNPGDTIGRVGNSGNARRASPHLHFAIYRPGLQPLDPTPLLAGAAFVPSGGLRRERLLGGWAHTTGSGVRVRATPSTDAPVIAELNQGTAVRVLGATRDWHRVRLEDGRAGFIAGRLLDRASLATN